MPLLHSDNIHRANATVSLSPVVERGRTNRPNPKNIRPICLLSCLGKVYEKTVTTRIARAGAATQAIHDFHMGSIPGISASDTLMVIHNEAQQWLALKPKIN